MSAVAEQTNLAEPQDTQRLAQFVAGVRADGSYDPSSLQIPATTREIIDRIANAYGLVEPQ